jgi:hypothetical protein
MTAQEASRRRQRRAHCRSIGKLGGLTTSATHDPVARTANARATFASSFEARIRAQFPDIDDAEVGRRADALKRLHYARMGLRSAQARAARVRPTDSRSEGADGSK